MGQIRILRKFNWAEGVDAIVLLHVLKSKGIICRAYNCAPYRPFASMRIPAKTEHTYEVHQDETAYFLVTDHSGHTVIWAELLKSTDEEILHYAGKLMLTSAI